MKRRRKETFVGAWMVNWNSVMKGGDWFSAFTLLASPLRNNDVERKTSKMKFKRKLRKLDNHRHVLNAHPQISNNILTLKKQITVINVK